MEEFLCTQPHLNLPKERQVGNLNVVMCVCSEHKNTLLNLLKMHHITECHREKYRVSGVNQTDIG